MVKRTSHFNAKRVLANKSEMVFHMSYKTSFVVCWTSFTFCTPDKPQYPQVCSFFSLSPCLCSQVKHLVIWAQLVSILYYLFARICLPFDVFLSEILTLTYFHDAFLYQQLMFCCLNENAWRHDFTYYFAVVLSP